VEIGNMNLDPNVVDISRYKKDFSDSLSAIIGSRAIIFMLYPPLVFFTIFASSLSNAPIFVYPLDFERYQTIFERNSCLFVRFKPYREGVNPEKRSWFSRFFGQFFWCCEVKNDEETEAQQEPERFRYYLQNKLALDCFEQAYVRLVAERQSSSLKWKSALKGIDIFFNESRGIRWLLNFYLYVVTVGVLYYPNLLVSTVWVLVPYAFFVSLSSVVFLGNLMAIDDDHLRVFNPRQWWQPASTPPSGTQNQADKSSQPTGTPLSTSAGDEADNSSQSLSTLHTSAEDETSDSSQPTGTPSSTSAGDEAGIKAADSSSDVQEDVQEESKHDVEETKEGEGNDDDDDDDGIDVAVEEEEEEKDEKVAAV